jgi:hypothetical protein
VTFIIDGVLAVLHRMISLLFTYYLHCWYTRHLLLHLLFALPDLALVFAHDAPFVLLSSVLIFVFTLPKIGFWVRLLFDAR